ncbi:uncharacterized protein LOC128952494 [Oppia nitens]|uniref:uncharacterized protein LOC128952494 n=1 Tax=Oppia nitens TaxID=1686743 RepID=UPI0023DB0E35|nr:uncharacterized protein LOC128952494 [Oppia nitens]
MQLLATVLISFLYITLVISDRSADIQCLKNGSNTLVGKSDQELIDLTQQNLQIGEQMVLKRAAIANASGLVCYQQFYDNYTKGLEAILLGANEIKQLDTASSPQVRSAAVKGLAGITQGMRCDEDWRAQHFNETVKQATCSTLERVTLFGMDLLKFRPKLELLLGTMKAGSFGLSFKNNVMSKVVGDIAQLYRTIYTDAERCSRSQPNVADQCRNLKMFVIELDRLSYLAGVQLQANLF